MIDSRDFLNARRRAETELLVPPGPKVAVTGGLDYEDHHLIPKGIAADSLVM